MGVAQEADGGATQAWDVYREIHKAMRFALFGVTGLAGSTDATDDAAVARVVAEWTDVRFVLLGHHGHEDDFCDEHVLQHVPEMRAELERAHHEADATIEALTAEAAAVLATPAEDRGPALYAFHQHLADFTSMYLAHLRYEDTVVMPALNRAMSDEELEGVTNAIRGSVTLEDWPTYIKYMVPAMTPAERLDMIGGMHAGIPRDLFEPLRAAAEQSLDTASYAALATAAGIS